jgi:hypothetical protein
MKGAINSVYIKFVNLVATKLKKIFDQKNKIENKMIV